MKCFIKTQHKSRYLNRSQRIVKIAIKTELNEGTCSNNSDTF